MTHKPSVDEYLCALMDSVEPLECEDFPLTSTPQLRFIAEDIKARLPIPRFDNSAVDGYAVCTRDLTGSGPWILKVAGDTPAGAAAGTLIQGEAVRVMTGAHVPKSSEEFCVVPVELTNAPSDHRLVEQITVLERPRKSNVRTAGEHLHEGEIAIEAGTACDAGSIATLISVGVDTVSAHRTPRVTVITTGDELEPDNPWGIPNSNGPMLVAALQRLGIPHALHLHAADDQESLKAAFDQVSAKSDFIITVGGISAGAFDVVKLLGQRTGGFEFFPIAMSPGKPQGHGTWKDTKVLCLPGNPVAAWVSFQLFAVPLIRRLAGGKKVTTIKDLPGVLLSSNRELPAREGILSAVPVTIDWAQQVARSTPHRSHMVGALAGSDGIAIVQENAVAQGDPVRVILGM